jgi:hypothetical protein
LTIALRISGKSPVPVLEICCHVLIDNCELRPQKYKIFFNFQFPESKRGVSRSASSAV